MDGAISYLQVPRYLSADKIACGLFDGNLHSQDTLYTSDGAYYFPRKKSRRSFDLRQLEAYSLCGILALWPEPENIVQFRLGLSSMMTEALDV